MVLTPIQEIDFGERGYIVVEAGDPDSARQFIAS